MVLLDTNVLSALMQSEPPAAVMAWSRRQANRDLGTAAICAAEILSGIAVMPAGRRRTMLLAASAEIFRDYFEGRVLGFDVAAAQAYAEVYALRRHARRPTNQPVDLMIAAVAKVHGAAVATRNVDDFAGCGVEIVNPWEG